jgi:sporulation protein YhbH
MVRKIEKDLQRFKNIIRGRIRKDLRKYISRGELIGKKGPNLVTIPIHQIDIPRFRYGPKQRGGVGQGEGEEGTSLGKEMPGAGSEAGDAPGQHVLEVEVELEELARMLGEELELPNIQPKGKKSFQTRKDKYTGIRRAGPESLRHFKRTYKEALKRQLAMRSYDPDNPLVIPIREDKRYRCWKVEYLPESDAVVIYMMDISGSMGQEQKEMVRIESFWINTWLKSQYKDIKTRYIVHDAVAREVDEHTFFHIRESGGTKISSAYGLCRKLIDDEYDPQEWNIYLFHFSDGDNWGGDDTKHCLHLMEEKLLPDSNLFCYGQVKSAYGSGQFIKDLRGHFKEVENLALSEINSRDEIYDSIKTFLGKGK